MKVLKSYFRRTPYNLVMRPADKKIRKLQQGQGAFYDYWNHCHPLSLMLTPCVRRDAVIGLDKI